VRSFFPFLLVLVFWSSASRSQDTFSIIGFDSITREVGAAGASCVDLTSTGFTDHFIAELFPDTGAVVSQAYYIGQNQANARMRVRAGDSPAQVMAWLQANDVQNNPSIRQYGVVQLGQVTAAHTGSNCMSYASHRTGPNYSIQGNILLGSLVLDSMEARFSRTRGDLACKLMAAMQGAKMPGADTRCMGNNSSSLFAFLKVSMPTDHFDSPFLVVGLRTQNGDSIEPVDSLQKLFDFYHGKCSQLTTGLKEPVVLFPNPSTGKVTFSTPGLPGLLHITDPAGRLIMKVKVEERLEVETDSWPKGLYFCLLESAAGTQYSRLVLR
jgi:uncharacterized Ntn-hydrolase superfamily protein